VNLTANFLETGQTTTYAVSSIPFAPPFPLTGGTTIFIGIDDVWSNIINLPFNFCFYGTSYNQIIIGTNGLISFDISLANQWCAFEFSASIPTPGNQPPIGTAQTGIYNNSINGAYHDIDPSVFLPGANNDINYMVLGTAPCRTFVLNYYEVPHFNCNNLATTQQIVLYETTNVIEIYILDKPTCFSWNSGNAVIGLQNSTGTAGITPPGRNTGPWTASNEAWRFTPNGPLNYTVEWYDGITLVGTGATVNVCPLATTTYTGQVTYTNCDASTIVETDTVQVITSDCGCTAIISSTTDPLCASNCDGTATVSMTSGSPPYTYSWSPTGGSGPVGTGLCGGILYTVLVTDSTGCSGTYTITLNIPPGLIATITGDDTICTGDNTTLIVSATGGITAYTYTWLPSGGPWASNTFSPSALTTYNVTVTDANGCSTSVSYDVEVNPLPAVNLTSDIDEGCEPLTVLFSNLSPSSVNCLWDVGDAIYNDCEPFMHTYNNAGDYDVTLIVTDVNGCTDSLKQNNYISVFPTPTADFITSPWTANIFNPSISFIDQSVLADCWSWDFAGMDTSTLQNPEFTFPSDDSGTYAVTLWVCTSSGCVDSITKFITIEGIYIIFTPNSFTPNNDGKNDVFIPIGVGIDENNFEMYIYDRWGNLIYKTIDINEPWDGKANGGRKIAQQDVYLWIAYTRDIFGKRHRYMGHVNLVR